MRFGGGGGDGGDGGGDGGGGGFISRHRIFLGFFARISALRRARSANFFARRIASMRCVVASRSPSRKVNDVRFDFTVGTGGRYVRANERPCKEKAARAGFQTGVVLADATTHGASVPFTGQSGIATKLAVARRVYVCAYPPTQTPTHDKQARENARRPPPRPHTALKSRLLETAAEGGAHDSACVGAPNVTILFTLTPIRRSTVVGL